MKGDFVGFSFNGFHSQDLGIIRVSDGDRYNDTLTPEIEDYTNSVPGHTGLYFYGSDFKERKFSIKIAYDHLTDIQLRMLRRVFSYKGVARLIFDEFPYKYYLVKVASAPELEYICFDERKRTVGETQQGAGVRVISREMTDTGIPIPDDTSAVIDEGLVDTSTVADTKKEMAITREDITPYVYYDTTERIYKGEGTLEFVAYYPYAKGLYTTIDEYIDTIGDDAGWSNVNDWAASSGLLTQEEYDYMQYNQVITGE